MTDTPPDPRAARARIDTLPPAERPAALAALADTVEAEGLPGVAKSLRLMALDQARTVLGPDAPLVAELEAATRGRRVSARPCPLDRPAPPDRAAWRERMKALAERRRRR